MTVLDRMTGALLRAGHSLVINGTTRTGVITAPPASSLERWFDATTLAGLARPVRQAVLPASDSSAVGQSVVYGGESLTVRKVVPATWRGAVLARRVLFS